MSEVGTQISVTGSYRAPELIGLSLVPPPQTIISLPVQSAVCTNRAVGAFTVLVELQLSLVGLYRPPVFKLQLPPQPLPPQTIISLPVHTPV